MLLTKAIRSTLPKLRATEGLKDPVVRVKFFSPYSGWRWYATEFDGEDTFYGYVCGMEQEYGYFSLSELQASKFRGCPAVERDIHFTPCPLSEALKKDGYDAPY